MTEMGGDFVVNYRENLSMNRGIVMLFDLVCIVNSVIKFNYFSTNFM